MIAEWDIWKFRGDDMKLFRKGQEIPSGWNDAPGMAARDPLDHDNDGRKGGFNHGDEQPVKRGPGRPRKVQS